MSLTAILRLRSPNKLNANNGWYHWDMLMHRPTCAATVKRKRLGTLRKLSIRKAKPTSLCHRQTSRPPSKKHRRNQPPESAQVPTHGASLPSHCNTLFSPRETYESPMTGSRKFRIQEQLPAQHRNCKYSDVAPLLGIWT
jgi:hypothetical protein